jgi:thiol-disulfide isomerase/thioredoxin
MVGAVVAAVVLLVATVFGLVRRHRDGVLRPIEVRADTAGDDAMPLRDGGESAREGGAMARDAALGSVDLGSELGTKATLVQFSTAFCAPCRATKRILGEVTDMVDGVAHVEIDAETHLDLVRRLGIVRTPTVLILDAAGRVVQKAVGQPRKADVIAALGHAIP